jgi:hypothetical protein
LLFTKADWGKCWYVQVMNEEEEEEEEKEK